MNEASERQQGDGMNGSETERRAVPDPSREGAVLHVPNSGLVILHPFLGSFFSSLGLLQDGAFGSPEKQERGVLLTEYLVTGTTARPEHPLFLNKILCGMPIAQPLEGHVEFTNRELEVAGALLRATIERWDALRSTSISVEGLRQTFLQREGRLAGSGQGRHLLVERRSYDVLLDRLPWNIATIREKWMSEPITVRW